MRHTAEEEFWKPIQEIGTNFYYVSNLGRIKSIRTGILKINSSRPYLSINRRVNGTTKNFPLHRLVAKYFVPNPLNKPQVNHKDGNKLNCRASNLEWVTHSENELHSYRVLDKKPNKTALGKFGVVNKLSVKVKCVETGVIYHSLGDAAKDNNVSRSAICLVLKNKNKTANKLKFIYHTTDKIKKT